MTDHHRRPAEGILLRQAFMALRTCSMNPLVLAEKIGATEKVAYYLCAELVRRGLADKRRTRHRIQLTRIHRAVVIYSVRENARAPNDRRGKPKASRNGPRGASAWARWIVMMQAKHGPTWQYRPRNGHPLDSWASPHHLTQYAKGPR